MSAQWNYVSAAFKKTEKNRYVLNRTSSKNCMRHRPSCPVCYDFVEKEENVCVCVYVHLFVDAQNVSGMRPP